MPNEVTTKVKFVLKNQENAEDILENILQYVAGVYEGASFGKEAIRHIDFRKIIPEPNNMFYGNLGKEELKMCKQEGLTPWMEWHIEHWGTKWNAYNTKSNEQDALQFDTAWKHPFPIMRKISELFPNVEIEVVYAEESEGYNLGAYSIKGGSIIFHKEFLPGSEEAKLFTFAVREI